MNAQQYATQKRDEIARILGEDPDKIAVRGVELMREGVLVSLHIGRWRGMSALSFDDLGLSESEKSELVRLGVKSLMPPAVQKKLQSTEVAARNFLKNAGFTMRFGTFVPVTNYRNVVDELERRSEDYLAQADDVAGNDERYAEWVEDIVEQYKIEARKAFRRATTLNRNEIEFYRDDYLVDEQSFVAEFARRVRAAIPTRDEIFDSFYFEIERAYVPIASMLNADANERERVEQAIVDSLRERRDTANEFVATDVAVQAQQERERMIAEMNRDVVADAERKAKDAANEFVNDMIAQVRQLALDVATDALDSIARNDTLHPRSVVALKNMIDTIESLNFYGDTEIEKMLAPVRAQLNVDASTRNVASVEQAMRDIATLSRSTLITMGVATTRKGNKITGRVDAVELESARRRVGIVTDIDVEQVSPEHAQRRASREF